MSKNVYDELLTRGLINQVTNTDVQSFLNRSQTIYCGFDPTGDSLHVGHLLPIIIMKHFENYGHKNIALVGGATGLIGDPSGKKDERKLNTPDIVLEYSKIIEKQLEKYLNPKTTIFLNNYDWFGKLSAIDFLRDYGKSFGINYMINKESIASRLKTGLSFTEFSYTIIQAMDFAHLYKEHNCSIQIGGSDQWGNITSGLELIRKENDESKAYGITVPLVTKSDGTKFGKTEGKAIWLDSKKTSPYEFYQFFLNTEDKDVIKYLKTFTFLELNKIESIEKELKEKPFLRGAQKELAKQLTIFVHGKSTYDSVQKISVSLFTGDISMLSHDEISKNFRNIDMITVDKELEILEFSNQIGLSTSKREGREFLEAKSLKINGQVITDEKTIITRDLAIGGEFILAKRGKKKFIFVRMV